MVSWGPVFLPVVGRAPRTHRRLRSEKSHQEAGGRGFDSRHLHEDIRSLAWALAQASGAKGTKRAHVEKRWQQWLRRKDASRSHHRAGVSSLRWSTSRSATSLGSGSAARTSKARDASAETLRWELEMARAQLRCVTCGAPAPEGLLAHRCEAPYPEPHETEG